MHEIGHSLGLKHGQAQQTLHGEFFDALPADHDSNEYSLMTCPTYVGDTVGANNALEHPTSYMQDDIVALQYMYGANYNFRSGHTVYSWSPTTGEQFVNRAGQGAPTSNFTDQTVLDGGRTDTYDFAGYSAAVAIDLAPGAWTKTTTDQLARIGDGHLARGSIANALLYQGNGASLIENATGGASGDAIAGNDARNTLTGLGGGDHLDGRVGLDRLVGGTGNDQYVLTEATYVPLENAPVARAAFAGTVPGQFLGSTVFDTVAESAGGGYDTVYVRRASDGQHLATSYTLTADVEHGVVTGSSAFDLAGNGLDNLLVGNAAANRLSGGDGADMLDGGEGDDVYRLEDVANPLTNRAVSARFTASVSPVFSPRFDLVQQAAGAGTDTVHVGGGSVGQALTHYTLTDSVENGVAMGVGAFALSGNVRANSLYGNAAANTLDGLSGADRMQGGAGDDVYVVDNLGNRTIESAGAVNGIDTVKASLTTTLAANVETLILTGTGNFGATGNTLANAITGNAGDNLIAGKAGNDILKGPGGHDSFLFDTALTAHPFGIKLPVSGHVDHIVDVSVADDTIRLDNAIFTALTAGALSPNGFKDVASGSEDANDHILYNHKTGVLAYDVDGMGGHDAITFAILDTKPDTLTAADFLVV